MNMPNSSCYNISMNIQDKKSQANRMRKRNRIVSVIPVVAFVIFAAITAFSVLGAKRTAETPSIANTDGVPSGWDNSLAPVETTIEARTVSSSYIEYTVALHNTSNEESYTLTNLSSHLAGGGEKGFISLDGSNLEYSYFPEDSRSWQTIELSHPGNDNGSFRLIPVLALGTAGSAIDTIYFRYDVLPREADGIIEDRVSALLEDDLHNVKYTTGSTLLSYSGVSPRIAEEKTNSDALIALNEDGSYTKPLGVSHYGSDCEDMEIIASTTSGNTNSSSFIMKSLTYVAAGLGVLIISYIIYIPFSRKR